MKLIRLEAWPVTMRLAEPYVIAYESVDTVENVFVRLVTDRRTVGCGCAAPDQQITGESAQSVLNALENIVHPALRGVDPLRSTQILENLRADLRPHPSAKAALDIALYDLLGKTASLPVWKLLGGYRECIRTSVTIGILPEQETVHRARDWVAQGFRIVKLKGGLDADEDAIRVLKVREAVGPEIELRFDANQGYTVEQAVRFIAKTRAARLELFEQPTPRDKPRLLAEVTRRVSVPVMADESLMTPRDAFRMAHKGLVDMFNVKIMKVGGIAEALQVNAISHSAGLEVMVGCMDESALGIAAGLHLALACSNVKYADLDGHLGLKGDPAATAVTLQNGALFPHNSPGFGAQLL